MAKHLHLIFALLLFGVACEQLPEEATGVVSFDNDTEFIMNFEAQGGTKNVKFTTDSSWTLTASNEWITLPKSSGTASEGSFSISVALNDSLEERRGYVEMVTSMDKSYRFDIVQAAGKPAFTINGSGEYEVLASGGKVTVSLETNLEYNVEIPSAAKSWITLADTRAMREDTLTFTIAANQTFEERKANISIVDTNNSVLKTIVIKQQPEEELFDLGQTTKYSIDENGGEVKIKVSTNLEYSVNIQKDAQSWLSLADTRTVRTETLVFTVQPNDSMSERVAAVDISVSNGKNYSLTFTQKAMPLQFTIDKSYISFDKEGGAAEVTVTTNVDYTITIGDDAASWLSYNDTRATRSDMIVFNASPIEVGYTRSADVVFSDMSGNELATLNIEQDSSYKLAYTTNDGQPVDIYKTEGFGGEYLGNKYDKESGCGWLRFYAPITAIPEQAFALCDNLTTIEIPTSVTAIGSSAFSGCSAMQEITIPESVTKVGADAFANCAGKAYINCNTDTNWSTYKELSFENAGFDEVVIGDNVEVIGYCAFRSAKLNKLTIGKSVKIIDEHAFANNYYLKHLVIPDSVTSIKFWAFYGCASLTSLTLGSGLTTLEEPAFGGGVSGSALELVYCKAAVPPTATGAIFAKTSNFVIYVPKDSGRDYKTSAVWSEYASCMTLYDFAEGKVDDPDVEALPRDKWIGVWDAESAQIMTIDSNSNILIEDKPLKFDVTIVPHPSFDEEVLIYGLSATNLPARAYVDDKGVINMVSGVAVGTANASGYTPTWLIYYEVNGNRGFTSEQLVSYTFAMNGDSATATPATPTLDSGVKLKVLSTEVYALNSAGNISLYDDFPVTYHAGSISLTRSATRAKQSSVQPTELTVYNLSNLFVDNSFE